MLYGGTAISLRLGHRTSVDFDFFTDAALNRPALQAALPFLRQAEVLQDEPHSLTVIVPSDQGLEYAVKLQFFGDISSGRVGEPELTEDGVLQVASLDDLMATKLKTILQRVQYKDYADIAAMICAGVSLERGLAAAQQMYAPTFPPAESLKAMTYFEGRDLALLSHEQKSIRSRPFKRFSAFPRSLCARAFECRGTS